MTPPLPNMFDDEDESSSKEKTEGIPATVALAPKKKWEDEEEDNDDDDDVLESWDAADDSEEERKKAAAAAAKATRPASPKKSKELRIAEKKAAAALAAAEEASAKLALKNMTPAEARAHMQAVELESDLSHASDLFAGGGKPSTKTKLVDPNDLSRSIDLASLPIFKADGKQAFDRLKDVLVPLITANMKSPGYNVFCQEFSRALAQPLSSEQIRLVASKVTTLANEKLKEEKAAEKGGKKGGKKNVDKKSSLAASGKEMDRLDTTNYDDAYDDFDDFM